MENYRSPRLRFITTEIGIDASNLSDEDIKALAQYVLNVVALEFPRIAAVDAKEIGLKVN